MAASWVGTTQLRLTGILVLGVLKMYEYEIRNGASQDKVLEITRFGKNMVNYVRDDPGLRHGFRFRITESRKKIRLSMVKKTKKRMPIAIDNNCADNEVLDIHHNL